MWVENPDSKHILITGKVQGVGYRAWLVDLAGKMKVMGWTRNRRDGTLEAVAYGEVENVAAFIEAASKGPASATVTEVVVSDAGGGEFKTFEIRPPG